MTANPAFWYDPSEEPEDEFLREHVGTVDVSDDGEVVLMFGDGAMLPDIDYVMTGRRR